MVAASHQNDAVAARRAQINKGSADELLSEGILQQLFHDALDVSEGGDAFGLLSAAFRRIASELQRQGAQDGAEWAQLVRVELDERADRQAHLRDGIMRALGAAHKPTVARGLEILQAGIAVCLALPPANSEGGGQEGQLHFLEPMAALVLPGGKHSHSESGSKQAILVLGHLVPLVPAGRLPPDALEQAVHGIGASDCPAHHGRVMVGLLQRADYLRLRAGRDGRQAMQAEEREEDAFVASEVSAIMRAAGESTRAQIARHVLPPLVSRSPGVAARILAETLNAPSTSDPHAHIGPYVDVAAVLVGQSLVDVRALDERVLNLAMEHREDAVRLAALRCLSGSAGAGERIHPETLGMIRRWLSLNSDVHHAEFRNVFSSLFAKLCGRFDQSIKTARRQLKKSANADEVDAADAYIASVGDTVHWILENVVDKAIRLPLTTNHARMIIALDVLSSVANMSVAADLVQLWPPSRVDHLLACLGSNFTDIRERAMEILLAVPNPLPGYETKTGQDFLLSCAYDSLLGARNTQAEAGQLLLRLLFLKSGASSDDERLACMQAVVGRLESHVAACERDLGQGLAQQPLHGLLSAVTGLVPLLRLTEAEAGRRHSPTMHRLRDLVNRVWQLCAPVLSFSSEGGAEHEIAKIYDMLDAEDADQGEHLVVLSGCWRAMKEAAHLLAVSVSSAICTGHHSDALSYVWKPQDIKAIGEAFQEWLRAIRHRGAFSSIAPSFEIFVKAVRDSGSESAGDLMCRTWLETELTDLQVATASTTRRSAAMPFRILALAHGHRAFFLRAVESLQSTAVDERQTDTVQTHALNALRIMVLDARHAHLLQAVAGLTAEIALTRIKSIHWSVKNAALLLFAGVTSRLIGKQVNMTFAAVERPIALSAWSTQSSGLLKSLLITLREARTIDSSRMAAFPVLSVLRNLQADETAEALAEELLSAGEQFLHSPEIMIRAVAGQACAAMTPKHELQDKATSLAKACSGTIEANLRHGQLLYVRALLDRQRAAGTGDPRVAKGENSPWDGISLDPATLTLPETAVIQDIDLRLHGQPSHSRQANLQKRTNIGPERHLALGADIVYPSSATDIATSNGPMHDLTNASDAAALWTTALDPAQDEGQRTAACAALSNELDYAKPPDDALSCLLEMAELVFPVTLAEAALRLLPRALPPHASEDTGAGKLAAQPMVDRISRLVDRATDEAKSLPSRLAGLGCLQAICVRREWRHELRSDFSLWRLVGRLLSDDDDDVRQGASDIVSTLLQAGRPLCRSAATAMWWQTKSERPAASGDSPSFDRWIAGVACDHAVIDRHVKLLRAEDLALFAPEPPNLFRQVFDDIELALSYLSVRSLTPSTISLIEATLQGLSAVTQSRSAEITSPIHPEGDSARLLTLIRTGLLQIQCKGAGTETS